MSQWSLLLSSCPLPVPLTPLPVPLTIVTVGSGQAKLATPAGWSQEPWPGTTTAIELVRSQQTATGVVHDGRIMVLTEQRSHDEAVDRLGQISAEASGAMFLLVDGWPALQRRQVVVIPPPAAAEVGGGRPEKGMLVRPRWRRPIWIRAEASVGEGSTSVATEVGPSVAA